MTVPLSEAVARKVPAALSARKARGALCAWMTLATVSERVEKRRTSPDCAALLFEVGVGAEAPVGDWAEGAASGAEGEGTGDG